MTVLLACGLIAKPLGAQTQREADTVRIGAWSVWCAVDGNLSGLDHEECRAWAALGPTRLDLTRTHRGIDLLFTAPRCPERGVFTQLAERDLSDPRTGAEAVAREVEKAAASCRTPAPTLDRSHLRALLSRTAGLSATDFSR